MNQSAADTPRQSHPQRFLAQQCALIIRQMAAVPPDTVPMDELIEGFIPHEGRRQQKYSLKWLSEQLAYG